METVNRRYSNVEVEVIRNPGSHKALGNRVEVASAGARVRLTPTEARLVVRAIETRTNQAHRTLRVEVRTSARHARGANSVTIVRGNDSAVLTMRNAQLAARAISNLL